MFVVAIAFVILIIGGISSVKRIRINPFLKINGICMIFFSIIFFIITYYNYVGIIIHPNLRRLILIPLSIIFFSSYLYYEFLMNLQPDFLRFGIFLGLSLTNQISLISNMLGIYLIDYSFFLTFFLGMIMTIFAMITLRKTNKNLSIRAIKLDFFSKIILFMSTIFFQIMGILSLHFEDPLKNTTVMAYYWVGVLLFSISYFILLYGNYIQGEDILFLPIKINTFLLYNNGGMLIYDLKVDLEGITMLGESENIISGALMAFSIFFKEILGPKTKLNFINATSYNFLFSTLPEETGTLAIIASKANYFLKRSLNKFSSSIPKEIFSQLNNPGGISNETSVLIDNFIKKNFPYLKIK